MSRVRLPSCEEARAYLVAHLGLARLRRERSAFCASVGDGARSVVLLLVHEDGRIEQVVRKLRKLEDLVEVGPMPGGLDAFAKVAGHLV